MQLTGKSLVFGILGDPVAHSLSPLMQNLALEEMGIDGVYVPFHVSPQDLPTAVAGLRALQVAGVNLTVPHKEAVLPLLDEIDPSARLIGAVNTIVNRRGKLVGYNTDGIGFLRSAQEELGFQAAASRVVLLGAGGACRAAVVALAEAHAAEILIANRSRERAVKLVAELDEQFPETALAASGFNEKMFADSLESADLVVNTTSIGLKGESMEFFPLEKIKQNALLYDMVYSRFGTPLLQSAKKQGFNAVDGLGMLAAQGEEAFFLWTGKRPGSGLMRNCLMTFRANEN